MPALTLLNLPDTFAVSKLPAHSPVPDWATSGTLVSITRTCASCPSSARRRTFRLI